MKFFKTKKINSLIDDLKKAGQAEKYWESEQFAFTQEDIATDASVASAIDGLSLVTDSAKSDADYKNAVAIYEAMPELSPSQASDPRLWTYLTHTYFWQYVQKRYPLSSAGKTSDDRARYVQRHWFVNPVNWYGLIRTNAISRLWWMVALTVENDKQDKYRLTKELFSMQDYASHLLTYPLGRSKNLRSAVLEAVVENPALFTGEKEAKVRFIMRALNLEAGRLIIDTLSREEIKEKILSKKAEIAKVGAQ